MASNNKCISGHTNCGWRSPCHRFKCAGCGRVHCWCFGAYDLFPNLCDDCWVNAMAFAPLLPAARNPEVKRA